MNIKQQTDKQLSTTVANSLVSVTILDNMTNIESSAFNNYEMVETEEQREQAEEL